MYSAVVGQRCRPNKLKELGLEHSESVVPLNVTELEVLGSPNELKPSLKLLTLDEMKGSTAPLTRGNEKPPREQLLLALYP